MTGDEAIEVVARHALACAAEDMADEWGHWGAEVGENDWEQVCDKALELCPFPADSQYKEAYALLSGRAETEVV